MKVLQINSVCGVGSTGRICSDLADVLVSQGHECKIAYGRGQVPKRFQNYAIRIGNNMDVNYHAVKARFLDRSGWASTAATRNLIKWIGSYNPDVIHLHNLHGYYLNIEVLFDYLHQIGKPIVWTLHDCWSFTGHCAYFDMVGCNKWKDGCHRCPQKTTYPSSYFLDQSKRNWCEKLALYQGLDMTITTPSHWLAGLVKQSILKSYPVHVINNGIDLKVFKPSIDIAPRIKYGLADRFIILGVASEWSERKGLRDFVLLSKMLSDDDRYRILLVGLSEKQVKGLPKNVVGISRTSNLQQLVNLYSTADVFVNPTYEDNYPTVNLEAIACGTPVITYNTGGSPETIDKFEGIIVPKGDINGLYSAIMSFKGGAMIKRTNHYNMLESLDSGRCFQDYVSLFMKIGGGKNDN